MADARVSQAGVLVELDPAGGVFLTQAGVLVELDPDPHVIVTQVGILAEISSTNLFATQIGILAEISTRFSYILEMYGNASNYIRLFWSSATEVTLAFNDGDGEHTGTWDATGAISQDSLYQFQIDYTATEMILSVGGVAKITISEPVNFDVIPTTAYWGQNSSNELVAQATFSPPA